MKISIFLKTFFYVFLFSLIFLFPKNAYASENKLMTFETLNLYDSMDSSQKLGASISPQIVTFVSKNGEWYLINTWLGQKYIKPSIEVPDGTIKLEKSIIVVDGTKAFNKPDITSSIITSFSMQKINIIGQFNDYYIIKTSIGPKWISSSGLLDNAKTSINQKITVDEYSYLYNFPTDKAKTYYGVSPQTVTAIAKYNNWYQINTYAGALWLYKKPQDIKYLIYDTENINGYNSYSLSSASINLPSQVLNSYEKYGEFYKVDTSSGTKWVQPKGTTEVMSMEYINGSISLNARTPLFTAPFENYRSINSLNAQIVNYTAKSGNYYRINTWLGERWVYFVDETNKKYTGVSNNKNVIFLQLESFENFLLRKTVDGQEITPNLNKLLKESVYFPKAYEQIGFGNTADAEFIANTSMYPNTNSDMNKTTPYSLTNKIVNTSFPRYLNTKGYSTMTMHANDKSFWNRGNMYSALGFNEVYDKAYFGTDDFIAYGTSDRIFFAKAIDKFVEKKSKGEKFYAHMIALSSHYPFDVGTANKKLQISSGINGTTLSDYLQATHYVDEQIGTLINNLKVQGLWNNTILVIYGDHFASGINATTPTNDWLNSKIGLPYDRLQSHNIPLIIHDSNVTPEIIPTVAGQLDIMPTVSNLLGLNINSNYVFGTDLLNTNSNIVGNRAYAETGYFINNMGEYSIVNGKKAFKSLNTNTSLDSSIYNSDYNKLIDEYNASDNILNTLPNAN